MAKSETVKVSKKGHDTIEFDYPFPESLEDPRWGEITNDGDQDVNSLAVAQFRVRLQAAARNVIEDGAEAVQAAVEEFVYGRRVSSGRSRRRARLSSDTVKKAKFSKEQLAALQEAGISIEGMDDDS
jgi:hypothetical protein